MGSLSLLQGIFLTQESNWGLLHCRRILYQPSYQGKSLVINPLSSCLGPLAPFEVKSPGRQLCYLLTASLHQVTSLMECPLCISELPHGLAVRDCTTGQVKKWAWGEVVCLWPHPPWETEPESAPRPKPQPFFPLRLCDECHGL